MRRQTGRRKDLPDIKWQKLKMREKRRNFFLLWLLYRLGIRCDKRQSRWKSVGIKEKLKSASSPKNCKRHRTAFTNVDLPPSFDCGKKGEKPYVCLSVTNTWVERKTKTKDAFNNRDIFSTFLSLSLLLSNDGRDLKLKSRGDRGLKDMARRLWGIAVVLVQVRKKGPDKPQRQT